MIDIFIPLFALVGLFSQPAAPQVVEGKSIDYRYAQSEVRSLATGPKSPAYAVCDMMETFTGVPMHLNAEALRAHEQSRGVAGSLALYYQYLLERQGLVRQESGMDSTNHTEFTHYLCPAGSVLSFAEPTKISEPGKIVSFLNEGIKGIVVTYAYCPKEWLKSNGNIQLKQKKHRPKGQHTVLIVGYQDSSFIFKNSWGPGWGEQGYGRMSFAYHYNHAREGLVAYLAEAKAPETNIQSKIDIKLTPEFLEGKPHLQAAVFAVGRGKLPPIASIRYQVSQGGQQTESKALLLENAKSTGYPCLLPILDTHSPYSLHVAIRLEGAAEEWKRSYELSFGPVELKMKND